MHGQTGSHEGRRLGILRTSRATPKGYGAVLCITRARRSPVEESTAAGAIEWQIIRLIDALSVGTLGDKRVDLDETVDLPCACVQSMTTLYRRVVGK